MSLHAHPDDEALLTGGTLALVAAGGDRVVLVTATDGRAGLSASTSGLSAVRRRELHAAAAALGCARTVSLGYRDSGDRGEHPDGFAHVPVEEAAARLAAVLVQERADVLTTYDPSGGYGHPDHRQVHRVGARAAEIAGVAVVLEATVDRRRLLMVLRWARRLRRFVALPEDFRPERFSDAYCDPRDITHRVDVRRHLAQKRAAMAAHVSQTSGGDSDRTLAVVLRLPRPVFGLLFGVEWFVQRGRPTALGRTSDVFAGVAGGP